MPSAFAPGRVVRATAWLLAGLGVYQLAVRPRLRWGADDREVAQALPGDGRIGDPYVVSTRAVSVGARLSDVWPWLAQMGDGRGGLYSYDLLDVLFGYQHARSAHVVLPEYRDLAVGDVIPLGRGPDWPVTVVDPERALVVEPAGAEVTWCWAIIPTDSRTRLVSRVRVRVGTRLLLWMLAPAIDLPWFMMERQMLHGIARRAEALADCARTTASTFSFVPASVCWEPPETLTYRTLGAAAGRGFGESCFAWEAALIAVVGWCREILRDR